MSQEFNALPNAEASTSTRNSEQENVNADDIEMTLVKKYPKSVKVEIAHAETIEDVKEGQYTVYEMKVTDTNTQDPPKLIFKRYSEFHALYAKLCEKYINLEGEIAFPPTSWFFKFNEQVIQQRREGLQKWLNYLLCHEKYSQDDLIHQFLQYDVKMLEKALNHYRAKLYNLRQAKHLDKEKQEQINNVRILVKTLTEIYTREKTSELAREVKLKPGNSSSQLSLSTENQVPVSSLSSASSNNYYKTQE